MAKRVKLARDSNVLGMEDEVGNDYDNLSLDGSQGEETAGSQDASNYKDNPKQAPDRLHFGWDWCLKLFQLTKVEERGVVRVCGGGQDCKRNGHKRITEQGEPGVYNTIKTLNYVDGILNTFRTLGEQKKVFAARKASLEEEVTSDFTGSKFYQQRLRALERELEHEEGMNNKEVPNNGNLVPSGEWGDDTPDDDLKLTGKLKGGSHKKKIK
jgi:hypothetical protein